MDSSPSISAWYITLLITLSFSAVGSKANSIPKMRLFSLCMAISRLPSKSFPKFGDSVLRWRRMGSTMRGISHRTASMRQSSSVVVEESQGTKSLL